MREKILGALVCFALLATAATGAEKKEDEPQGRALVSKQVRTVKKGLFLKLRLEAMKALAEQTDVGLIREFKLIKLFESIAKDNDKFAKERVVAIESLVTLFLNGVARTDTLPVLIEIFEDKASPFVVREYVLRSLGQLAQRAGNGAVAERAFEVIDSFWKKRTKRDYKLPPKLLAVLVESAAGFYQVEGTMKLLQGALEDGSSEMIRLGALRGLQRYLAMSEKTDSDIFRSASTILNNSKSQKMRLEALRLIQVLIANGMSAKDINTKVKDKLLVYLEKGNDTYVDASLRVLMLTPDVKLLKALLKEAWPNAKRSPKLSYKTYVMLNSAVGEALVQLRGEAKKSDVKKFVDSLAEHYAKLLPADQSIPKPLRLTAIEFLGAWPKEFDRLKPVGNLLKLLAVEEDEEVQEAIVEALQFQLGVGPFTQPDEEDPTKEVVDPVKWKEAAMEIKDAGKLKAGEDPRQ